MKILLTGASGFLGKAVLQEALKRGLGVRPCFRSIASARGYLDATIVPMLDGQANWSKALEGVDVVIHTAARTHLMGAKLQDKFAEYQIVNVEGTLNLARQSAIAGAKRFVFISSIKVNGELTLSGSTFLAEDVPAPKDAYGASKAEAEFELRKLAQETTMEVTIIRPPLIYGPGVKGNFATLIKSVRNRIPLPFRALTSNRRSFVALDNLVDLILVCTHHQKAANQTFLISDGEDLSTSELIIRIGKALKRPPVLIWFPTVMISFLSTILGRRLISERLLGSLCVDIRKTCELLDWHPLIDVDEGLRRAVE